jgi:predicted nucleic acid-binding protein
VQVLVDTNIWSLALRRSSEKINDAEKRIAVTLQDLIRDERARLIGPIRQELLSGVRELAQFERLRQKLGAFPDEPLATADFEYAAHCANQCRARGIAGQPVDFLICAVSLTRGWPIFTTDGDFKTYAKVIPIRAYASTEVA